MRNSFDTLNVPRSRGSTQEKEKRNSEPATDRCCASSKIAVLLHVDYRLIPLPDHTSDINSSALTHRLTQKSRLLAASAPPRSIL
jgi:hypothetical protein